jgi:hypothetical protein
MGGTCSMDAENEKRVTILVGHPEGKKSPGRPRSRCEHTIKWISIKWSESAPVSLRTGAGAHSCGNRPSGSTKNGQCLGYPSNYQLLKMELVAGI